MSDLFSWRDKAQCIFGFAVAAHNDTWKHDDGIVRAGGAMGGGILMSFATECALKALLDKNKIKPDKIHNLHSLFSKLPQETQVKLNKVYEELLAAEQDQRALVPPLNALDTCLKHHDNAFKEWRYDIKDDSRFYPGPMMLACASLLTFLFPEKRLFVNSATSKVSEVLDGKVTILNGSSRVV